MECIKVAFLILNIALKKFIRNQKNATQIDMNPYEP